MTAKSLVASPAGDVMNERLVEVEALVFEGTRIVDPKWDCKKNTEKDRGTE
ncbi:hypothetical protein OAK50_02975 [Verrucomicrobiales bacterium]|jgi:hypothetical protein|nr:hypothetical protein [Verrucomicrobiales bacterium]MDB2496531.1 hypothetical protein [Verrucomicrobiales bacterium]MDB3940673.1 hypothetical protein [Verrucomicrobiales bacterium]MDC0263233.1 hypothetical protein [Verrucomicrobiales bacterium]